MLSFPLQKVRAVLDRGRADAQAHGGFRKPFHRFCPEAGELPGLWLVGDHGVYLMSNGKLPAGGRPLVVYAEECDPHTNDDWFHIKRKTFGGDDGVDFIDATPLEAMMAANPGATHLRVSFHDEAMQLVLATLR